MQENIDKLREENRQLVIGIEGVTQQRDAAEGQVDHLTKVHEAEIEANAEAVRRIAELSTLNAALARKIAAMVDPEEVKRADLAVTLARIEGHLSHLGELPAILVELQALTGTKT